MREWSALAVEMAGRAAPDLYEALDGLTSHYVEMVRSGDCGKWDPEGDEVVVAARRAMAKARGG